MPAATGYNIPISIGIGVTSGAISGGEINAPNTVTIGSPGTTNTLPTTQTLEQTLTPTTTVTPTTAEGAVTGGADVASASGATSGLSLETYVVYALIAAAVIYILKKYGKKV